VQTGALPIKSRKGNKQYRKKKKKHNGKLQDPSKIYRNFDDVFTGFLCPKRYKKEDAGKCTT
jgi:hypothetical protein